METWMWIVIAVVVLIIAVVLVAVLGKRRRAKKERQQLVERYGSEYDRTVRQAGSPETAEAELRQRDEQFRRLRIRSLSADEQRRLTEDWRGIQHGFVDDPAPQTVAADDVLTAALRAMGYPTDDFDRQADALSVEHAAVTTPYRRAHAIADDARAGRAGTEELRQAMLDFRAVFDELVAHAAPAPERGSERGRPGVDAEGRVVAADAATADQPPGREASGPGPRSTA